MFGFDRLQNNRDYDKVPKSYSDWCARTDDEMDENHEVVEFYGTDLVDVLKRLIGDVSPKTPLS